MAGRTLSVIFHDPAGVHPADVQVTEAVIAGWTGRDPIAVEKHIRELEALGVRRPSSTPVFYRVAASRLTTDEAIEVTGEGSSGEVEFVLLRCRERTWVGVGSDHTDRDVERYDVTVSKQMCDKPLAPTFWALDEVIDHWDRLTLRSHIVENGGRVVYQKGAVTAMLDPLDLLARYAPGTEPVEGTLMFCGTLAARGGVRPASTFEFLLEDPVLGRIIAHRYRVISLPTAT